MYSQKHGKDLNVPVHNSVEVRMFSIIELIIGKAGPDMHLNENEMNENESVGVSNS